MTALIVVDMQNDFMPGGALPVSQSNEIIPLVNKLIDEFDRVIATQDWHPKDHVSFAVNHKGKKPGDKIVVEGIEQILWPVHCVQNTFGAEFVKELNTEKIEKIFHKGTDRATDGYSTFFDNAQKKSTGLENYLKSKNISNLYIAGVATDYCVLYSVLDALDLGFSVTVMINACKGINLQPHDVERAIKKMKSRGAKILETQANA